MKIEIETITPDRAQELLKLNVRNRDLNGRRIADYADQMRRGQWTLTHQGISISPKSILDGQHRLKAILAANVSVKMIVCYEDNDDNFTRVDTGRPRSAGDAFSIEGIKNAKQIAAGIGKYLKMTKGYGGQNVSRIQTHITHIDVLETYNKDYEFWQSMCNSGFKYFQKLPLFSVTSIMSNMVFLIMDKEYNPEKVLDFFNKLFGVVEKTNVHCSALRDVLIKDAMSQKKLTTAMKNKLLIRTWNNHLHGDYKTKLSLNFVRGEKLDFE